jgi:hypothetical protein
MATAPPVLWNDGAVGVTLAALPPALFIAPELVALAVGAWLSVAATLATDAALALAAALSGSAAPQYVSVMPLAAKRSLLLGQLL